MRAAFAALICTIAFGSLAADLLDVVHDTVRPAHASVWLRER